MMPLTPDPNSDRGGTELIDTVSNLVKGVPMRLPRPLNRPAAVCAALWLALAAPAVAETAPAPADSQTCGGIDVLAEAQTKDPDLYNTVTDQAKALENSEALLWKVEKSGAPASYVFGTIHLSDPRVTTLSPKVKEALGGAKTVVLEFVGGQDAAVTAMTAKAGELLVYTDGTTLESKLSPEDFAQVKALVGKMGLPGEIAGLMRPWILNMLLSISDCERQKMEKGAEALDGMIEKQAAAEGKTLAGLETPEQQLQAMTSIPEDQQLQMLKAGLKYAHRSNDMIETLVQMYLKRQIGGAMPLQIALAAKVGTPASAYDGFAKLLLTDRNARMRDAAKPILDNGAAFIGVGALHLPGKAGLITLLRDAGYTVTAVE